MGTPGSERRSGPVWAAAVALGLLVLVAVVTRRGSHVPLRDAGLEESLGSAAPGVVEARPEPSPPNDAFLLDLGTPSPSAGWEEAATVVAQDLRRLLDGRPRAGAYEEARAEAARQDLALHPPDRARLRRLLLGGESERLLALAALAARPELDDDLLRIVLRSQHPEDDDLVRLLGAEIVQGAPPALLSRHDEDLYRAFERETNPLVLAVALPALERMDASRLRALLRVQLAQAGPEMLPVLYGLARSRLGAEAFADLSFPSGAASGEPR